MSTGTQDSTKTVSNSNRSSRSPKTLSPSVLLTVATLAIGGITYHDYSDGTRLVSGLTNLELIAVVGAIWFALECYMHYLFAAMKRPRQYRLVLLFLLMFVSSFVSLTYNRQVERAAAYERLFKLDERLLTSEDKVHRQFYMSKASCILRSPDHLRITSIDFRVEEDLGCGCCYGEINSSLNDQDMETLAYLPYLENLTLGRCDVTDEGLVHLGDLPSLKTLDLSQIRINGAGLKHLANIASLEHLLLNPANSFEPSQIVNLASFDSLKELTLGQLPLDQYSDFSQKWSQLETLEAGLLVPPGTNDADTTLKLPPQVTSAKLRVSGNANRLKLSPHPSVDSFKLSADQAFDECKTESFPRLKEFVLEVDVLKKASVHSKFSLSDCPQLEYLTLTGMKQIELDDVPKLRSLALMQSDAHLLAELDRFPVLDILWINSGLARTVADLENMKPHPGLTSLLVCVPELTDRAFAALCIHPNLKNLTIQTDSASISSNAFNRLNGLSKLRNLTLRKLTVTGTTATVFNLKDLKQVQMHEIDFDRLSYEELDSLTSFDLNGSVKCLNFKRLRSLTSIGLYELNQLTSLEVDQLPSLKRFSIMENRADLEQFTVSDVPVLDQIKIQGEVFDDKFWSDFFRPLRSLKQVELSYANYDDQTLATLRSLPNLDSFESKTNWNLSPGSVRTKITNFKSELKKRQQQKKSSQ